MNIVGALAAIPYIAMMLLVVTPLEIAWNSFVENPMVRSEARQGYVTDAVLAAEQAKVTEIERQRDALMVVNAEFTAHAAELQRQHESETAELEKRISDYEKTRTAQGRSCTVTAADLAELHNDVVRGARRGDKPR